MITTNLKKCSPNRHGLVSLDRVDYKDGTTLYWVTTPDDEDGVEFDDLAKAEARWTREVALYSDLPNWEAQAEYDEMWGR